MFRGGEGSPPRFDSCGKALDLPHLLGGARLFAEHSLEAEIVLYLTGYCSVKSILEVEEEIRATFAAFTSSDDKWAYLLKIAREHPGMDDRLKAEKFLVTEDLLLCAAFGAAAFVNENSSIVVHNYCAAELPKITVTIRSGQTTYRFGGSYDGTRSLSGKLLDHMAKEVDEE